MQIIGQTSSDPFARLFTPPEAARLTKSIYEAVRESFEKHKVQNQTRAEIKNRFDICFRWCKILRGDHGWPLARICDSVSTALNSELSGIQWVPSERTFWYGS